MQNQEAPREPLIAVLIDANKRASAILDSTQRVSAKLYGSVPTESSLSQMQELSVYGLAHDLVRTLAELEREQQRQHDGLGDVGKVMGASSAGQARAVSY